MAENLVLATLQVNADGTISAYSRTGQAATLMERQTRQSVDGMERKTKTGFDAINFSSKRLIDGFLNLRRLISGLFIGFSVGGFIFALGQMVASEITATSWFKTLKEAAVDFFRALAFGESDVERFSRKAAEAMKAAGITTAEDLKGRIAGLREAIQREEDLLQGHAMAQTKSFLRNLTTAYFQPGKFLKEEALKLPPTDAQIVDIKKNLGELRRALGETQTAYDKLGTSAKAAAAAAIDTGGARDPRSLEGLTGPSKFGSAGREDRQMARDAEAAFRSVAAALDLYLGELQAGTISQDEFMAAAERGIKTLQDLGFGMTEIGSISALEFTDAIQQQADSLDLLIQKYEMWIYVLGVAQGVVAAAANAGIISAKRAAQAQQALLAGQAIMQGMMELARAAQAIAGGPYTAWMAPLHKFAAGLFFATAAFHAAGAVGAGGGGGGGGGGGRGGFADSGLQTPTDTIRESTPSQQITIIVEGSIIGSDPNAIARWLEEIKGKAKRDGMRSMG